MGLVCCFTQQLHSQTPSLAHTQKHMTKANAECSAAFENTGQKQMLNAQRFKKCTLLNAIGMQKSKTTSGVWRGGGGYETRYIYML